MPGPRRFGKPRTDAERKERHFRRFGTRKLPPRGTGLVLEEMERKSTRGSPEFTQAEINQGYRKL